METSVFLNNRTQVVRLPLDMRFDDNTRRVNVRLVGQDRVLSPIWNTWDTFFTNPELPSEDFMQEIETAAQEREEM